LPQLSAHLLDGAVPRLWVKRQFRIETAAEHDPRVALLQVLFFADFFFAAWKIGIV
jgi:hypothetical protein